MSRQQHYLDTIVARVPAGRMGPAQAWADTAEGLVIVEDHDRGEFIVMPGWAAAQYVRYHDAEIRDA